MVADRINEIGLRNGKVLFFLFLFLYASQPALADRLLILSAAGQGCETSLQQRAAAGLANELYLAGHEVIDPKSIGRSVCDDLGRSLSVSEGVTLARSQNATHLLMFDLSLVRKPEGTGLTRHPLDGLWRFLYRVDLYDVSSRENLGGIDGEGLLPSEPTSMLGGACNDVCMSDWKKSIAADVGREIAVDVLFRQGQLRDKVQVRLALHNVSAEDARLLKEYLREEKGIYDVALLQSGQYVETFILSSDVPLDQVRDSVRTFLEGRGVELDISAAKTASGDRLQVLGKSRWSNIDEAFLIRSATGLVAGLILILFSKALRDHRAARRYRGDLSVLDLEDISRLNRLIDKGWLMSSRRKALTAFRKGLDHGSVKGASLSCSAGELLLSDATAFDVGRPGREHESKSRGQLLTQAQIPLDHPQVSRLGRHARLFLEDGRFCIEDQSSTNGTSLPNKPVLSFTPIPQGETHIRFGGQGGEDIYVRSQADSIVLVSQGHWFWCLGAGPFSFAPQTLTAKGVRPSVHKVPKERLMVRLADGVLSLRGNHLACEGRKLYGWIPVPDEMTLSWAGEPIRIKTHEEERG